MLYTLYDGLNKRVKYSLTEDVYMIAQTQLKKPSNWQDFEKLCKLLWGEIWICEDTIKRHVVRDRINMELMYFRMLRNIVVTVASSAKVRMTIQMHS